MSLHVARSILTIAGMGVHVAEHKRETLPSWVDKVNPLGTELFSLRMILILSFRQMYDLWDNTMRKT